MKTIFLILIQAILTTADESLRAEMEDMRAKMQAMETELNDLRTQNPARRLTEYDNDISDHTGVAIRTDKAIIRLLSVNAALE